MDEEKKEVVVYDNRLNNATFNGMSARDMDIFMSACILAKDKGTDEIQIEYSVLQEMTRFWNCTTEEFHKQLKDLREKILHMTMYYETEDEIGGFVLFQTFRGNKKTKILTLRASTDWAEILNDIKSCFTMFDLSVFIRLKSKHSKTLYRLLSQYRNKQGNGWWLVNIDDFKRIFDIPKGYRGKDIVEKIVKPSVKECEIFFGTLTFEPIYAKKRGKPLEQIRFEFTKAANKPKVEENVSTALPEQAKQEKKPRKKQTYNKFNDFPQREYTQQQIVDLEKRLLSKSLRTCKEMTDSEKKEFDTLTKNCVQSEMQDFLKEQKK